MCSRGGGEELCEGSLLLRHDNVNKHAPILAADAHLKECWVVEELDDVLPPQPHEHGVLEGGEDADRLQSMRDEGSRGGARADDKLEGIDDLKESVRE